MSKPETPCHPDCYVGAGGSILHAPGCTKNAPKAEAPPAPVSEPPRLAFIPERLVPAWDALTAERDALKAQLDTDREVLKETENNISNLAKFAASPITPNYNLPMSGLAIAIRDSLAAALGREILLTQEWDALKAQNVELAHEIALAAENWAEREESFNVLDGQVDRLTAQNADLKAELERLRDLILDIADGQEDGLAEARSARAAREAAEIDERELRQLGGIEALVDKSRRRREERAK